jgi:hypothetical protein
MSNSIEIALDRLVNVLRQPNSIRAVGSSGGDRPFPEPGTGDVDLFVYCSEIPSKDKRMEMLVSLEEAIERVEIGRLDHGHWGEGDCFLLAGVETWLLYFTMEEAHAELNAALDGKYLGRLDSYYYPIGRCAMWKAMRVFYDPDGFLQSIKRRLEEYPHALAVAVLDHHLNALDDVEDLERAVQRKDVFFFHFAMDLALDHFLQAIFALNKEYFPSRKRSESYLQGFRVKPVDCESRLRQVIALGANAETLHQSYEIWKALNQDLRLLTGDSNKGIFAISEKQKENR